MYYTHTHTGSSNNNRTTRPIIITTTENVTGITDSTQLQHTYREREGGDRESQTTRNTPYWRTRRVSPELPVSPLPQMNKVNTNCKSPLVIAEVRTRGHKQEKKGGKLIT